GGSVADIGAGIGHLAIPLGRRNFRVAALEPARAMLGQLKRRAAAERVQVEAVNATAEQTTLASGGWDLVLLADVLQWVDPELAGREAARLVRAGGTVAVVESQPADTPFQRELQALLARVNPRAKTASPALRQFLSLAATGAARAMRFDQQVHLDQQSLASIIRSLSYVGPALGPAQVERVLAGAAALAELHGGPVWRRELTLTWAGASS
ncbi:MAG TPA: class I SAM-dependent methyltransferase, partial [Myxococcaceae bacterium]|nr:class I SAM-dependent methyltransferase [Myxococcaceae bacterium]